MKLGLVLGGGGLIGLGYHAGALKALEDRGVDVSRADVIVGTSAGALVGAYLGSGWSQSDLYDYATGAHPAASADPHEYLAEIRRLFTPAWATPAERVRRGAGSLFVMASSRGLWRTRGRRPAAFLRRAFPSGMYSTAATRTRLNQELPEEWPDKELYLCAAEVYSGRRVAFGSPGAPKCRFPDAVLASTAIPGAFEPVRIADGHYVDGGVVSATSLDLADDAGCEAILCIAPLGYRKDFTPPFHRPWKWTPVIVRAPFARTLRREVRRARERGTHVAVIRPWLSDLEVLGANSMRYHDRSQIVEVARRGTHRLLDELGDDPVLAAFESRRAERDALP
jgi:NTE family protein